MDIDIDDILAELDRDTTAVDQTLTSQGNDTTVVGSDAVGDLVAKQQAAAAQTAAPPSPVQDFNDLLVAWRNERMCPEILAYPHLLMARTLRRVQQQMEHIECVSMGFYEDETRDAASAVANKLPLLCMEADLERLKFVVRSYIRCRLSKVDKFSLYLRQLDTQQPVPLTELLSSKELEYHERHFTILLKLLNSTILKHMPPELQAIDDNEGSVPMVEGPDLASFVFVRVTGPDLGRSAPDTDPTLEINDEGVRFYPVYIQELREEVELTVDGIYVMRYNVVQELVQARKAILI
ncbi:LAMI_0B06568g1_1 [Lachancea mirantina]|uniref:DNA replication complex GINS protein SLD5 n=1 Tax=Lachancea mirantina TaxID=1230905 RepID=A0A1G4IWP0_9SACH|nr:LAMI_0B06568g1_1 [Lachancea mirantina]